MHECKALAFCKFSKFSSVLVTKRRRICKVNAANFYCLANTQFLNIHPPHPLHKKYIYTKKNIYILYTKVTKPSFFVPSFSATAVPLLSPQFLLRSLLFWSGLLYSLIIQTADLFDLESYPFNLNYSWHFYSELIACDLGSGSMEFVVPPADPASFFPISVRFTAASTFSDLKVANILPLGGGPAPKFSQRTLLTTETCQVV
ncbi:unnamed protein product [Coffea canephora]|uniref:Coatomer subunit delta n=1 Tax=Coffea canephora TaxID=49390 RepID=A0A068V4M0_COFCA|nr:unnamed protein product [Coffea canephora]